MRPTGRTVFLAVALALAVIVPLWAHHSIPPSFQETFTDIQAVVKEVRMTPPHAWLMTEVKSEKGEAQVWPLEAASPPALQKIGVTADYVKAGDTIKARCRRIKVPTEHTDCILGFVKAKDGTVKDWSGNNALPPSDF
jgi:hypothetical protein